MPTSAAVLPYGPSASPLRPPNPSPSQTPKLWGISAGARCSAERGGGRSRALCLAFLFCN